MSLSLHRRMMLRSETKGIYIVNVKDLVIEISENGSCIGVWDDESILQGMGHMKVVRLADVDFDNDKQGWTVCFRNGVILPGVYSNRVDALIDESIYVDEHLAEFGEWVESMGHQVTLSTFVDPSMS